jgi:hypothetical protein
VDGAGHVDLALDVEQALLPGKGARSDAHGEAKAVVAQVDLRERNSWRLTLSEVPTVELLEVQLVNAIAPFVLNARLKPLMVKDTGVMLPVTFVGWIKL